MSDFSVALTMVKAGHRITREGWNAKGMYVIAQKGYPEGIGINQNTAEATGLPAGTKCSFQPYLMIKAPAKSTCRCMDSSHHDPTFVPWVPSMGDLFANDWFLADDWTVISN